MSYAILRHYGNYLNDTSYEEVHKYCMDDWNLDETHTNRWNKVWYTLHPINYVLNIVIDE